MRYILSLIIISLIANYSNAQELFMSRDIAAAYKKGTRNMDGNYKNGLHLHQGLLP